MTSLLLRLHVTFRPPHHHHKPSHQPAIKCGPRDNRGPLYKGRTLSIEAIQAVQSLKRAHLKSPLEMDTLLDKTLSRLIKSDLIAAFNELVRQDQLILALKVLSALKTEEGYKIDLNIYAKLVSAMARNGMGENIDELVKGVSVEDVVSADGKGVVTIVKALLAADKADATVRVYEMLREGGCEVDDYLGRVLSRGLRRLGRKDVASEIDKELGRVVEGGLEKVGA
ncbi:protein thylakoid assembly 8, chloroplastic [Tanacetum coccineum]|uniref:Protein thylakoid assembly 8, chloroplastic n=1 Tax=Tanacetum coccineum TaxID=301880 RepID=A0ABQ5BZC3_9ASTR